MNQGYSVIMPKAGFVLPYLLLGVVVCHNPALMAQSPGTFTATGNMTTPRAIHTATLLLGGRVLIAGGAGANGSPYAATNTAELYDPATGTFAATGNMTTARSGHSATRLPDGRVLISGGYPGRSAEIYDPSTGTFASTGSMTTGRQWHTATLLNNGMVLITGGNLESNGYTASAELYDPSTGIFATTGNMTTPRYGHKATLLPNGRVLIAPGSDGADYESAEVYDPGASAFTPVDFTNSHGMVAATANVLTNGRVLLTLQVAECDIDSHFANLYDPSTGTFAANPDMNYAHCQQISSLLSDGSVLIAASNCGFPGTELYDPVSGMFSPTGDMTTGRFSPTATLLNNGNVLIAGGFRGCGEPLLASAELYNPRSSIPPPVLLSVPGGAPGQGAILHADTHQVVSPTNPATAGEALEIYCTGLMDGSVVPPQVAIGGRLAEVMFFGKAPGFAGLNQVNVRVPSGVSPGPALSVRLTYVDRPSNEVTLSVQ
jgi:Galactose oxidase, central domain